MVAVCLKAVNLDQKKSITADKLIIDVQDGSVKRCCQRFIIMFWKSGG